MISWATNCRAALRLAPRPQDARSGSRCRHALDACRDGIPALRSLTAAPLTAPAGDLAASNGHLAACIRDDLPAQ